MRRAWCFLVVDGDTSLLQGRRKLLMAAGDAGRVTTDRHPQGRVALLLKWSPSPTTTQRICTLAVVQELMDHFFLCSQVIL